MAAFEVAFDRPVSGFDAGDVLIGGTAAPQSVEVNELGVARRYGVNLLGMQQSGTVIMQVGFGAAVDGNGQLTPASVVVSAGWIQCSDDLAPLSDEFADPATLGDWKRKYIEEGWTAAEKLETWDIATSRPGHMRLVPSPSVSRSSLTGAIAYKEITGDFVATLRLGSHGRGAVPGRPRMNSSLAGLMVRAPAPFTQAAPVPDPGWDVRLPWPPPPPGEPGHFTSDWLNNTEQHVALTWGNTNSTMLDWYRWHYRAENATGGTQTDYHDVEGVPIGQSLAALQVVRVGSTLLFLRHHEGVGWILENRYDRPDFPATVQVGIPAVTNWEAIFNNNLLNDPFNHNRVIVAEEHGFTNLDPDLIADVDFVRFHRPGPLLTEALLQSAPLTADGAGVQLLAGTGLEDLLGDHAVARQGIAFAAWAAARGLTGAGALPLSDGDGDGLPLLLEFALDLDPFDRDPDPRIVLSTSPQGDHQVTFRRRQDLLDVSVALQRSPNLSDWNTVAADGVDAIQEILAPDPDGDGSAELVRITLLNTSLTGRLFVRLAVALAP